MKKITALILTAGLALAIGCSKPAQKEEQVTETVVPSQFVAEAIEGTPVPIPQARSQFKPGDEVLLTGLIMGVPSPFVQGRSVFVLGDEGTLTPCDIRHGDTCKMPWDVCCDPIEERKAGTATIQLLDENGKLLNTGLKGVNGLSELSRVTVAGRVAPNSSPEAFIVNADAIHIGVR